MLERRCTGSEKWDRRRSALTLTTGSASRYPARLAAGSTGLGSAGETLDGGRIVRSHNRSCRNDSLVGGSAQAQDERDQGEHMSLNCGIAASQHAPVKWRHQSVAANATGSIAIAGIECGLKHFTLKQDA